MHTFRYLMPLDTMVRISRQKLCEDFDNVLERVDKEDIGFVIVDDEGKEGHVLCPARWMEYCFDDDFGCIINSALRYAISRHTYMPGVVVDFIRRYINIIDTKTIDVTIKDTNIKFLKIIYVLISIAKTKEFANQNASLRILSKSSSLANGFSYNSVGSRLLYEKAI